MDGSALETLYFKIIGICARVQQQAVTMSDHTGACTIDDRKREQFREDAMMLQCVSADLKWAASIAVEVAAMLRRVTSDG